MDPQQRWILEAAYRAMENGEIFLLGMSQVLVHVPNLRSWYTSRTSYRNEYCSVFGHYGR